MTTMCAFLNTFRITEKKKKVGSIQAWRQMLIQPFSSKRHDSAQHDQFTKPRVTLRNYYNKAVLLHDVPQCVRVATHHVPVLSAYAKAITLYRR